MSASHLPARLKLGAWLLGTLIGAQALPALAEGGQEGPKLKEVAWSFEGPLGTYDRAALQRGFQVFKEVCASCHSLKFVAFHNLGDAGGPGFSIPEVKALAAAYTKEILDDTGQPKPVPRTPADTMPAPFPNEQAARAANGGALPPDLSLITHAREGEANYVYSLLTGFEPAPADMQMRAGMNYNLYFPGHQIGMPPPLTDNRVTYADGTAASLDQEAKDVVTFLEWAAEPKMEERKRLGLSVLGYLALLSVLLFWSYRRIWHGKH
jgi:cytochrome c1